MSSVRNSISVRSSLRHNLGIICVKTFCRVVAILPLFAPCACIGDSIICHLMLSPLHRYHSFLVVGFVCVYSVISGFFTSFSILSPRDQFDSYKI